MLAGRTTTLRRLVLGDKLARHMKTVITTRKGKNKSIVITKPQISSRSKVVAYGNQVDVVFVIDATGSMDDKIQALLLNELNSPYVGRSGVLGIPQSPRAAAAFRQVSGSKPPVRDLQIWA